MSMRMNLINNLTIGFNSDLAKAARSAIIKIEYVTRTTPALGIAKEIETILNDLRIVETNINQAFGKNMAYIQTKHFSDEE